MECLSDSEIQEYGKMISILSNRMVSNKEVAQEAAQEAWVELLRSLHSFNGESKLSTWIFSIAKRVISRYAVNEKHYSVRFLHDFLNGDDRKVPDCSNDIDNRI